MPVAAVNSLLDHQPLDIHSYCCSEPISLTKMVSSILVTLLALAAGVSAGSIKDIKHVVLFMQENRAFDHVCPSS